MNHLTEIWLGMLTLSAAVMPAWVNQRGKTRDAKVAADAVAKAAAAESADKSQAMALDHQQRFIDQLQEEVADLRRSRQEDSKLIRDLASEFNRLEQKMVVWEIGIKVILGQLADHDIVPLWVPEDLSTEG